MHKDLPDRSLGFLLGDSSRLMRQIFTRKLEPIELTQTQWRAIAQISRLEGLNQVTLAELLEVQPITVARLVDRLETTGWVERRPDPNDRRAQRLFLTGKAGPLMEHLWSHASEVEDLALADFDAAERELFLGLLIRVRRNLSAACAKDSSAEAR